MVIDPQDERIVKQFVRLFFIVVAVLVIGWSGMAAWTFRRIRADSKAKTQAVHRLFARDILDVAALRAWIVSLAGEDGAHEWLEFDADRNPLPPDLMAARPRLARDLFALFDDRYSLRFRRIRPPRTDADWKLQDAGITFRGEISDYALYMQSSFFTKDLGPMTPESDQTSLEIMPGLGWSTLSRQHLYD